MSYGSCEVFEWEDAMTVDDGHETHVYADFSDASDAAEQAFIDGADSVEITQASGWYYWCCFPGCLPEGDPIGPFATEEEAVEDAKENGYIEADEEEEG